jgi:hypothetical protein
MTSTGYSHSDKPEPDMAIGYTRRGGDGLRSKFVSFVSFVSFVKLPGYS